MHVRVIATAVLASIASFICSRLGRKFRLPLLLRWKEDEDHHENHLLAILKSEELTFSFNTLRRVTGDFCNENKLGEGGFGSVYKGKALDGRTLAIKRLAINSRQDESSFYNEVSTLRNIQHRNLVRLLGCCAQGKERLLVYEYLPNKSLDHILFDPEKRKFLDWPKRYSIIQGIARGLVYLHEDSQLRIIHRDLKISNILLDDKFSPKIADFGLAKFFPDDQTHVSTKIAGTLGYMAPEYLVEGQLSEKADIFSFGVLVLEIIAGRKVIDLSLRSSSRDNLLELAWRLHKKRGIVSIIDPALGDSFPKEEVMRCIRIALLCTQSEHLRPPMSYVVVMLASSAETIPDPTIPAFIEFRSTRPSASRSTMMSRSFGRAAKLVRFSYRYKNYSYLKLPLKFPSNICSRLPPT
uniref:TSA: Wollemia nobilis Ref_Wollemi_Transcript_5712_1424 transcribed RNA sequence n=1 Tax=Wollemia nobilis TaxID=56998 RepID=A0A0C9RPD1_9CONI